MFNYFYKNFMWNFSCVNPLAHKENKKHMTLIDCRKECMQNEKRNCSPAWKCSVWNKCYTEMSLKHVFAH